MQEILQEITNTPRRDVRVDRESGVLYGVKIIGCSSRNGRQYPNETLREATALYENSKVNLDHPEGDPRRPRSYQDRFGVIRNVRLREDDGLYADFRFNPKHAVAEQLLWDAENAPENVGFSHNVEALVRRENEQTIVEKILSVRSVDLVADPATTSGLFESVESEVEIPEAIPTDIPTDSPKSESDKTTNRPENVEEQRQSALMPLCRTLLEKFREHVPGLGNLIDESFLETISSISDEPLVRRLVEDRIRFLERIQSEAIVESKPISREQFVPEKPVDVKTFVKLIRR